MKTKITRLLLSAVLVMCCTVMNAAIEPSEPQTDGNGNYELSTAAELYWFANYVNSENTSANAILTEDITVNESVLDSNGDLASGTFETWTPIGEGADDKAYSGEFNGNGHTISGLYCKDTGKNNIGLFGKANNGAYIHDLGLKDSYFSGNSWVAGICGDFASGKIENCWNAATVISNSNNSDGCCAGGIAASCWTGASVKGCYNIGKVTAQYDTQCGGICGVVNSTVSDCVTLDVCNAVCKDSRNNAQISNVAIKDIDAFKSGEVCWLLNNGVTDGSQKWYQTLGTDDVPSLSTSRGTIFKITDDQGECEYANAECQHGQTYLSYQAAVCPTNTTTGRYGHWHCSQCGKNFIDESCTIEATEENLTVPVATDKEIWYTTTDNKKLTPYKTDVFGATYDDANNVYEKGLGKIAFNTDVTSIGYYAFNRNNTIQSISIPSAVKKIGDSSFWGCAALESVIFSSMPDVDQYAFGNCGKLTTKVLDLTDSDKPYIGSSTDNYPGFTTANYHGTLTPNTWGTIVLPFVPESTDALEIYRFVVVADNKVNVSKVQDVQAGVPHLIKNVSESADFTLTAKNPSQIKVTATDQTVQTFTLKGSFKEKTLDGTENQNLYCLDGGAFKRIADMQTIAPFRAYIESSESSEVQSMDIELFQHTPTFVNDGYIPTATTSGRYGHWHCSHCNKDFMDESCTIEATEEELTVPVAKNNEIWYTTTNNQKLVPYPYGNFGDAKYNDANNVYEKGLGVMRFDEDVTIIGYNAFYGCSDLTSIEIPNSVTKTRSCAFANCESLQSVIFSSLPDFEVAAFIYCYNLKTKTLDLTDSNKPYIGTSLNNYPSGGFTEAKYTFSLTKDSWGTVVLPFVPSSESISNLEFYSYEGVEDGKVYVSKATDIQAGVPYLVKNVSKDETTSFTLTATNPTITLTARSRNADGFTFKGCFRSSDIAANSNLYYLDGTAFQKATQDNNVAPLHAYIVAPEVFEKESMDVVIWNPETAPEFVDGVIPTATTTGKYGYWRDESQNKFWNKICTRTITDDSELTVPVAKDNEIWYTSTDNYSIEPIANTLNYDTNEYQYGLGKIVLADGVTEIAKDAFNSNKTMKSIFIPSSVKKVGNSSFWGCDAMESVIFSSMPDVDQYAFGECDKLTTKVLDLKEGDNPYINTSLDNYPSGGFTEAKYTFSLTKDSWGTVVLPFVPSSESISNLEFYGYEGVDDGKVFVSEATDIQAGVPYLVKNVSKDETTSFTLTAKNPTITLTAGSRNADGFTFKGCFRSSDIAANSNFYYLDGTAFQKATQDNNVAPLHAYIVAPETFEKESMGVEIWNPETVPVFVGGVIPTATTTGRYEYWLDKSENKKYWNKFCTKPITDDSELTVPVAKDNEIWYTTTDNKLIENGVNFKTNEYQYGLGKIVLADGVKEIADNAFNRNKTLKSIFIPSAVKKIGNSSFWGCDAMESVIFSSLPNVDQYAFEVCDKLTTKVLDLTDSNKPYIGTSLNNYPSGGFTQARFSISLEKNSWETVVLPFVPTNTDGLKFYSCSKVNDKMLEVKETAEIRAGVPYLVKNTSDSKTNFTLTATDQISIVLNTSDPESVNGFTLKGTFQTKDLNKDDSKKYYYWNGSVFCQVTAQQTVNPIHAYIETSDMSAAVDCIIPTDQEGQVCGVLAIDDDYILLKGSAGSYYLDNVDLKYGHSYYCTDDFKATNSSYKFYVNPGKWNSWFVPFAVTTGTLEANNLTAAYIAGIRQYEKDAEGNITTQVDIIKIKNARLRAGTPYLVKYDGEDLGDGDVLTLDLGKTDFAASSDVHPLNSATTTASYDFIGCYEKAEFDISDKDMYYFIGSNGSLVHSKSNSFSALDWYLKVTPKGDVYDDLSTPSLAKSIIFNVIGEEDETTGIRTLYPAEKQVKEVYDLSGRRINSPKKGQINIINGKKILVE